jgi:hypothetical protein
MTDSEPDPQLNPTPLPIPRTTPNPKPILSSSMLSNSFDGILQEIQPVTKQKINFNLKVAGKTKTKKPTRHNRT